MAIDTEKYTAHSERDARHSALLEFSRDERRPAVLLLSALMLSALFFAIGLMVGRWTAEPNPGPNIVASSTMGSASTPPFAPQPTITPVANAAAVEPSSNVPRAYSLLVATYDADEKAQTLMKALEDLGYPEVRTNTPRAGDPRPRYSVLVGRFSQDEAAAALRRLRSANHPRMKNAKVIKAPGN